MYQSSYSSRKKSSNINLKGLFNVVLVLIVLFIFIWVVRGIYNWLFTDSSPKAVATATLIQGSATMVLKDGVEYKLLQDKDESIFTKESVTTAPDSFIIVRIDGGSIARVDESTKFSITNNVVTDESVRSTYEIAQGQVWFDVKPTNNTEKTFDTLINLKRLIVATSDARLAVSTDNSIDAVRVFGGEATVSVLDDTQNKVTETYTVGVGQQIFVTSQVQKSLKIGQNPSLITAIDDEYKLGTFYKWNAGFYSDSINIPVTVAGEDTTAIKGVDEGLVSVISPKEGQKISSSLIDVSGTFLRGKVVEVNVNGKQATFDGEMWKVTGVPVPKDGENILAIEGKNPLGNVVYRNTIKINKDLTPLPAPTVTFPQSDKAIWADPRLDIKGNVTPETVKVQVNDFVLTKFKPGDTEWSYIANLYGGNMKYGLNTFTIYALDEAGNKSLPKVINVYLRRADEDITLEQAFGGIVLAPQEGDLGATLTAPIILEPNGGRSFETSDPKNTLKGVAPDGASKIQVNEFVLKQFKPGDKTWQYFAWAEYDTLKPGKNTYNVWAIDANGKKSPAATIEITYLPGGVPVPQTPEGSSLEPSSLPEPSNEQ